MGKPRKQGVRAIRKHLDEALSVDERDEILALLLSGLAPGNTDAFLDGLLASAEGGKNPVARLRALIERAGTDDDSFERCRGPLANLALDTAGERGLPGVHSRRRSLWEALRAEGIEL